MGFDKQAVGLLDESRIQGTANAIIDRYSNIGSSNPAKGPTARSLFYEAGKRSNGKYGNFLFYSLGNSENDFIDAYYRSENSQYNKYVSEIESKNPSASFLVNLTAKRQARGDFNTGTIQNLFSTFQGEIVGSDRAPYYWKDFLYCKHYGTIPNNYMITLRRYPTPVLDNLSIPETLENSDLAFSEGVGRPVAQAVTWLGGNTGNSIKSLLSFTTGINWKDATQYPEKTQEAYSKGFFQDGIIGDVLDLVGAASPRVKNFFEAGEDLVDFSMGVADPDETNRNGARFYNIRDRAKDQGGLLGEYIWTSVDTVQKGYARDIGLKFTWRSLSVVFEYELTSVGEVNTKASMMDILANLLSIGTNYGNFLTPDFRYNSRFKNIRFPGGDEGKELSYSDPQAFLSIFGDKITNIIAESTKQTASGASEQSNVEKLKKEMENLSKEKLSDSERNRRVAQLVSTPEFGRFLKQSFTKGWIENYQQPLSFMTGAPIGEWHLTIGNPLNPIAMIGNLICTDLDIEFSEILGPDDFPTSIKATFTLEHARDRERGEIESIFNRGEGRFYHSAQETSANQQSFGAFADTAGNVLEYGTPGVVANGAWNRGFKTPVDNLSPNNP